jgi:hypothetical protein
LFFPQKWKEHVWPAHIIWPLKRSAESFLST